MYRKLLALLLSGAILCTTEVSVLAEDDQIFGFDTEDERVWDNSDPFVYESEISDTFLEEEIESDIDIEEEIELETEEILEYDDPEWELDYEINPIYENVLDEDDLNTPESEAVMLFFAEEPEYCTTDAEVIAILKEAMLQRTGNVTLYYRSEEAYNSGLVPSWTSGARVHTGVPDEGDYLHLHYAGSKWSKKDNIGDDGYHYITIKLALTYYTDASQEAAVTDKINEVIDSLDFASETTDIQKFDKIYTWICEHVIYDYDASDTDNLRYSAYGALFNHKAVCQGYASLLYRMLLTAGVPARAVTGKAGTVNHAWNIIKIGDVYYNADATWDAQSVITKTEMLPYTNYFRYMLNCNANFGNHTRGANYSTEEFNAAYPMSSVDYREREDIERYTISFEDPEEGLSKQIMPVGGYEGLRCMLPDAQSKSKPYEVSFDSTGGSSVDALVYDRHFLGWNTKADGTGDSYAAYDYFGSDQDMTLYTQWDAQALGELPVSVRKNYVFEGWFTQAEGGKAISEGQILAEDLNCYAHWKALAASVSLNQSSLSLKRTQSVLLTASVAPVDAENKKVTWKSSNASVSVDSNGRVTGNIPGDATITVTTVEGGHTAACQVTVLPKDDIEGFVTRFYNVLLDRRPDQTGFAYWTDLLRSKKISGESVAHGFVFSKEFTNKKLNDADFVEYLYKSILGRASDPIGKTYWCDLLKKSGCTREKVFQGFIDSTEFGRLCDRYGIIRR